MRGPSRRALAPVFDRVLRRVPAWAESGVERAAGGSPAGVSLARPLSSSSSAPATPPPAPPTAAFAIPAPTPSRKQRLPAWSGAPNTFDSAVRSWRHPTVFRINNSGREFFTYYVRVFRWLGGTKSKTFYPTRERMAQFESEADAAWERDYIVRREVLDVYESLGLLRERPRIFYALPEHRASGNALTPFFGVTHAGAIAKHARRSRRRVVVDDDEDDDDEDGVVDVIDEDEDEDDGVGAGKEGAERDGEHAVGAVAEGSAVGAREKGAGAVAGDESDEGAEWVDGRSVRFFRWNLWVEGAREYSVRDEDGMYFTSPLIAAVARERRLREVLRQENGTTKLGIRTYANFDGREALPLDTAAYYEDLRERAKLSRQRQRQRDEEMEALGRPHPAVSALETLRKESSSPPAWTIRSLVRKDIVERLPTPHPSWLQA